MSNKFLQPAEEALRQKCNDQKMSDVESAYVCGISPSAYHSWRKNRDLPFYKGKYNASKRINGYHKQGNEIKNRVVLTADDVSQYRHNDNTFRENSDKVILKVDINPVLDLPEPTLKLADSPQGSRMGVVIGSKWDKNRELTVTARQDTYANTVKRLVRNG